MFECLDTILSEGPQRYDSPDSDVIDLIGFPINAILDWPMGTMSGYDFFTRPSVDTQWKAVLDHLKNLLSSPDSLSVLSPEKGWQSADAINILTERGNDGADSKHSLTCTSVIM